MENVVLMAVRQHPNILKEIINDPENHLSTHNPSMIELMAFDNIQRQAFGRRRYANASDNRRRTYRNYLDKYERKALELEIEYLQRRFLQGVELYKEIARVLSIRYNKFWDWRSVKAMLEMASEIIADIELSSNVKYAKVA
jgi:hypothetical protein